MASKKGKYFPAKACKTVGGMSGARMLHSPDISIVGVVTQVYMKGTRVSAVMSHQWTHSLLQYLYKLHFIQGQ